MTFFARERKHGSPHSTAAHSRRKLQHCTCCTSVKKGEGPYPPIKHNHEHAKPQKGIVQQTSTYCCWAWSKCIKAVETLESSPLSLRMSPTRLCSLCRCDCRAHIRVVQLDRCKIALKLSIFLATSHNDAGKATTCWLLSSAPPNTHLLQEMPRSPRTLQRKQPSISTCAACYCVLFNTPHQPTSEFL